MIFRALILCIISLTHHLDRFASGSSKQVLSSFPQKFNTSLDISGAEAWVPKTNILFSFSHSDAWEDLEFFKWSKKNIRTSIISKTSSSYEAEGCYCETLSTLKTCQSCFFCGKDVAESSYTTRTPLFDCRLMCSDLTMDQEKTLVEPASLDCPWSLFSSKRTVVEKKTVIKKIRLNTSADKKVAKLRIRGSLVECSVDSGECTHLEGSLYLIERTLKSLACEYSSKHIDLCTWYIPLNKSKNCPKIICPSLHDEIFLTSKSAAMPSCLNMQRASISSQGHFVIPQLQEDVGSQCDYQTSSDPIHVNYKIDTSNYAIYQYLLKLEHQVQAINMEITKESKNEVCPDLNKYRDGNYMITKEAVGRSGERVEKVMRIRIFPKIFGMCLRCEYFSNEAWKIGYYLPLNGLILKEPCGTYQHRLFVKGPQGVFKVEHDEFSTVTVHKEPTLAKKLMDLSDLDVAADSETLIPDLVFTHLSKTPEKSYVENAIQIPIIGLISWGVFIMVTCFTILGCFSVFCYFKIVGCTMPCTTSSKRTSKCTRVSYNRGREKILVV